MAEERLYAVLSEDIVESRRYTDLGPAVRDAIKGAYQACSEEFGDAVLGIDVFRGDSWQVLVRVPGLALRVGLLMRALIRSNAELSGADTRLAIGVGAVEFVDEQNLSESQGEAFTLSGEALERLQGGGNRMAVALPARWRSHPGERPLVSQETLDTMMALLDAICTSWTAVMAETVAGALRGWTQQRIAEGRGVAQSTASRMLDRANWAAVAAAVKWWEDWVGECTAMTRPVR